MKNLKEFESLIKRYETITLEEIEASYERSPGFLGTYFGTYFDVAKDLTGFGSSYSCTLCKAVGDATNIRGITHPNCKECVYGRNYGCCNGVAEKTYLAIDDAETADGLLLAFRNRAEYMKGVLKRKLKTKSHA